MFVWALVFSGLRYYQSASIECNGVTQKIHMRKIAVDQGLVSLMENDRFHDQRPLDKPKWKCQGPGVRADTQWSYSTWLEELASESNTIQAQYDSQSSSASLKKLSSESNNGGGKVWVNKEANIFVASGAFRHDVLRIHLSDLDAGLE